MYDFQEGMDYHLLKRNTKKNKNGTMSAVYYVGVLSDERDDRGRRKYLAVRSTGTGRKELARKRALRILADQSIRGSRDNLRSFLIDFWTPGQSDYLSGREAEGRNTSPDYCSNNVSMIRHYFLDYCDDNGIEKLNQLTRANLYAWRNDLFERREKEGPVLVQILAAANHRGK
jgi:hypothetical protein